MLTNEQWEQVSKLEIEMDNCIVEVNKDRRRHEELKKDKQEQTERIRVQIHNLIAPKLPIGQLRCVLVDFDNAAKGEYFEIIGSIHFNNDVSIHARVRRWVGIVDPYEECIWSINNVLKYTKEVTP